MVLESRDRSGLASRPAALQSWRWPFVLPRALAECARPNPLTWLVTWCAPVTPPRDTRRHPAYITRSRSPCQCSRFLRTPFLHVLRRTRTSFIPTKPHLDHTVSDAIRSIRYTAHCILCICHTAGVQCSLHSSELPTRLFLTRYARSLSTFRLVHSITTEYTA